MRVFFFFFFPKSISQKADEQKENAKNVAATNFILGELSSIFLDL